MKRVIGTDGSVSALEMTMAEWKRLHRDYKTVRGRVRYALTLDTPEAGGATVSVPVTIVRGSNPGMDVANEILRQLGAGRFIAMTGAKNLTGSADSLSFSLPGGGGFVQHGINHVRITLEPSDTYRVVFSRLRARKLTTVEEYDDVYSDSLRELFEHVTGLRTSLGTLGRNPKSKARRSR